MSLMASTSTKAPRRRGSVIPERDLQPPVELKPVAQKIWHEVLRARPDYYGRCDAYDLALWCTLTAELEMVLTGVVKLDHKELEVLTRHRMTLARALRLTANTRAEADSATPEAPPAGAHELDSPTNQAPWQRASLRAA